MDGYSKWGRPGTPPTRLRNLVAHINNQKQILRTLRRRVHSHSLQSSVARPIVPKIETFTLQSETCATNVLHIRCENSKKKTILHTYYSRT